MKERKPLRRTNATGIPLLRSLMFGCLATAAVLVIGFGFQALATNPVFESAEPALSERGKQFESKFPAELYPTGADIRARQEHNSVVLPRESMPPMAKEATSREEASQIIAQGTGTDSQFVYDPYGRIAQITDPGGTVRLFVWAGEKLCEERNSAGAITKQFFPWGEIIGGTKYYYTRDHLGSVVELTSSSGAIVAQYRYDAYGNVSKIQGTGVDSDFLYGGYFYHQPSGLYITAHRLYSPKLGRWLNRDPVDDSTFALMPQNPEQSDSSSIITASTFEHSGEPPNPTMLALQGVPRDRILQSELRRIMAPSLARATPSQQFNEYAYADNSPVSRTDPSGLASACPSTPDWDWCAKYCDENAKGALAWILCMESCLRGFK